MCRDVVICYSLFFFFLVGCQEKRCDQSINYISKEKVYYQSDSSKVLYETFVSSEDSLKSIVYSYYENETIRAKVSYFDSERHGESVYFHPDGQLMYSGTYVKGLRDGIHSYYDSNGRLLKEEYFTKGKFLKTHNYLIESQ